MSTAEHSEEAAPEWLRQWMRSIDDCLDEICKVSTEGKLNSDQKLKIANICRNVSSGVSQMAVHHQATIQKTKVYEARIQNLESNASIAESLVGVKLAFEKSCAQVPAQSFADMVKKGSNNFMKHKPMKSITIYPTKSLETSESTKELVQKIISPGELKLHIRGVRKTKNGGVIISTESQDDIEKLKQSKTLTTSGLKLEDTLKRKPRIILLGVPTTLSTDEVLDCMFEQNVSEKVAGLSRETFMSSVRFSHKSGKKDASACNFIFEVSADIRRALIKQDRLFINWSACPVRDFTLVTRCYKCQAYGHSAKYCRDLLTCGHCGEIGHSMKDCPKKLVAAKCATCYRYNKPSNHKTGDTKCPAKINAEEKYINSIDYE